MHVFDQCVEQKHPSLPLWQMKEVFFVVVVLFFCFFPYLSVDVFGITGRRLKSY